ncbi:MAG: UDP-glucose 4-epimerase GalE [Bacteroidota bacterium]|jgi:UDP-glucose 4-epimerase
MAKCILVTGGAGYIGSHTCVELLSRGYDVIILDNFSNSSSRIIRRISRIAGKSPSLVGIDLSNRLATRRFFSTQPKLDAVIHFAAFKAVGESCAFPLKYYENNLFSTINLLNGLKMLNKPVKGLVFSSSCTVYGQPALLPVTEQTPMAKAQSPYGYTKQVCEEMILSSSHEIGFPTIALRYFNPVGAHASALIGEYPNGTPNNLMPYITQTAAGKREKLTIYGNDYNTEDGTCIRDFIHVCDLAEAHFTAIKRLIDKKTEDPYEVFNIGTGKGISVMEMVNTFQSENKIELPYVIGPRREGDVEKIYADTTLAETKLGWKAKLDVRDMVRSAWNWELSLLRANKSNYLSKKS